MGNFQDKIFELSKYNFASQVYGDKIIISITYNPDWEVIKPETEDIACANDEEVENRYYYMTSSKNGIDCIMDLITKTIDYNKELEKKVELFEEKIEELKDIFSQKSYEELRTLKFTCTFLPERKSDKGKKIGKGTQKRTRAVQKAKSEETGENGKNNETDLPDNENKEPISELDAKLAELNI